jgi:Putative Ig domain
MSVPPLAITRVALPWGRLGSWYSARLTQNGGGMPPLNWNLSGGSLPPGLSLSPSGVVSGIPKAMVVNTPFSVSVSDTAFGQDTRAVYLDILAALIDQANPNFKFSNGDFYEGA